FAPGPSVTGVYAGAGPDWARAVAATSDGGYVIAGQNGWSPIIGGHPLPYAGMGFDVFVLRLDRTAGLQWQQTITDHGGRTTPSDITADELGNVYVAGNSDGGIDCGFGVGVQLGSPTAYACSFARDGTPRWQHEFGGPEVLAGPYNVASGVAAQGGSLAVVGNVRGDVDFGDGTTPPISSNYDTFVVLYDSTGK